MRTLVDVVKPISDKPDDLFICSTGVESTCLDVPVNAFDKKSYKAESVLLIRYYEPEIPLRPANWFNSWEDHHAVQLYSNDLLNPIGPAEEVKFARGQPSNNIHSFQVVMKKSLDGIIGNVSIDATSIHDEDLLSLLYLLDKPGNNIRILYSEPPSGKLPSSRGILNNGIIPHFFGNHLGDGTYRHVSVLLAGYDSGKVYSVEDHIRSRDTFVFFPKPSFHKNWDALSKKVNHLMVGSIYNCEKRDVSGLDPLAVKSGLEGVYNSYPINEKDYGKRWYMQVGLAGCTLWQTVGAYLFVRDKMETHAGSKGESYDSSPISVYFCTSLFPVPIEGPGRIGEFLIPRKELKA